VADDRAELPHQDETNKAVALGRDSAAPIIARLHSESHDDDGITVLRDHQRLLQQNRQKADSVTLCL
jgi:hypothetical protein